MRLNFTSRDWESPCIFHLSYLHGSIGREKHGNPSYNGFHQVISYEVARHPSVWRSNPTRYHSFSCWSHLFLSIRNEFLGRPRPDWKEFLLFSGQAVGWCLHPSPREGRHKGYFPTLLKEHGLGLGALARACPRGNPFATATSNTGTQR